MFGKIKFGEIRKAPENSDVQSQDGWNVKEVLKMMDSDGDGYITLDKLREMAKQLSLDFSEEEMQAMIQEADPSGQGRVDFKEVNTLFEESKVAVEAEDKLMSDIDKAFQLFDTGQTGGIHPTKLAKALRIANMYPTEKDVRDIMKKLGYPKTITHEQFKQITLEVSETDNERLVAAFQCFDKENKGHLSEEKLRQILNPAICADFTRDDLEQIVCEFCVDGQVDLEVFVAYISGQEQYLSNTKIPDIHKTALEFPTISEDTSEASGPSNNSL